MSLEHTTEKEYTPSLLQRVRRAIKSTVISYALPIFLTMPALANIYCGNGKTTNSTPVCVDTDNDRFYASADCGSDVDCDDTDSLVWRNMQAYADDDRDGFGAGDLATICTGDVLPAGYALNDVDCGDNNNLIYPGSFDSCDGLDNDCDPLTLDGSGEPLPFNSIQTGVCLGSQQTCLDGEWQDTYGAVDGYETKEVTCDGLDNDCNGRIDDELVPMFRECTTGVGDCVASGFEHRTCLGESGWSIGYSGCDAVQGIPGIELCDDRDQDCDGDNYNGFLLGGPCTVGMGDCAVPGVYVCSPEGLSTLCEAMPVDPLEEICDGLDNDCNGVIDDHLVAPSQSCTSGVGECLSSGLEYRTCLGDAGWSIEYSGCDAVPGTPQAELCDSLDNDCNGVIDDHLVAPSRSCTSGAGECLSSGLEYRTCLGDAGWSIEYGGCDAVPGLPRMELCDDRDQDCDGDNYNGFPLGGPCTVGMGDCAVPGVYICSPDGLSVRCDTGPGGPPEEMCDDLDNNCNGVIDEGLTRENPICGGNIETCVHGAWYSVGSPSQVKNDPSIAGISCNGILVAGASRGNGVYWIDPNGGLHDDAYLVVCDMTTAGGGWTLVMQSLAGDDTFLYSSAYWGNDALYNPEVLVPGCATAKYQSYIDLRSREYMLNLVANRSNRSMYTHSVAISPPSLFSMTDNTLRPDGSNLDMREWTIHPPACASSRGEGYVATIVHPTDRVLVRWDVQHYSAAGLGHAAAGLGIRIEPRWPCTGEWGSKDAVLLWIK